MPLWEIFWLRIFDSRKAKHGAIIWTTVNWKLALNLDYRRRRNLKERKNEVETNY